MTTTWGPIVYPVTIDSFTPALVDNVDEVIANHPNSLATAIRALETKLGINNNPVTGLGGVSFDSAGKAANPGAAGSPTIWVDNSGGPGYGLFYTDDLGSTYDLLSGGGSGTAVEDWAPTTIYATNQEVLHVGLRFRALSSHTSGLTFFNDTDLAKWECVSGEGFIVNQVAHGLAAKDCIYSAAGVWAKADASDGLKLSDPPVMVVGAGTNYFLAAQDQIVTVTGHGLTVDEVYFLSAVTPGLLTSTEPSGAGEYTCPVVKVLSANTLSVLPYRPALISSPVTLDTAYDGGGAGVGRQITVDSGPVQLNGTNATALMLITGGAGGNNSFEVQDSAASTVFQIVDDGSFSLTASAGVDGSIQAASGNLTILAGDTVTVNYDVSNTGTSSEFFKVARRSGGSAVDYIVAYGDGGLLLNAAEGNLLVQSNAGDMRISDNSLITNYVALGWTNPYMRLTAAAAEWTAFDTNFGNDASLIGAVNTAYTGVWSRAGTTVYPTNAGDDVEVDLGAVTTGSAIVVENDFDVTASANHSLYLEYQGVLGAALGKVGYYRRDTAGDASYDTYFQAQVAGTTVLEASDVELFIGDGSGAYTVYVYTSNATAGNIYFSDTAGGTQAGFEYDHSTDVMTVRAGSSDLLTLETTNYLTLIGSGGVDVNLAPAVNTDVDTGTETVDSFSNTGDNAAWWFYRVANAGNLRAGFIQAVWDDSAGTTAYTESSTADIGDTSDLTFAVDMDAPLGTVRLRATAASDNWNVSVARLRLDTP